MRGTAIAAASACLVAALSGDVQAGEGGGAVFSRDTSLADYIGIGMAENRGLRADFNRFRAALEKIPQARSLPDPKLSVTHFIEEIQTRTGPQRNQFMLSQTFPWFGKRRLRGEIASKEAHAVHHEYENAVLELIRDISLTYYDYAYLAKSTEITEEILQLLRRLEETVREKVRVGNDRAPLLRLQVEVGKNEDTLQGLRKERRRQSAAFSALLNRRDASPLPYPVLTEPVTGPIDRDRLVADLMARNPELQAIQSRFEKAGHAVKLSKLRPVPDPTIGASYLDTGSALNAGTPGSGKDPYGFQVSFKIPLWFGKYKAERREAIAEQLAVQERLSNHENMLLKALDDALENFNENAERASLYTETLLPRAREAFEVTAASYAADRASITDYIDSERTLLELENAYWRAVAEQSTSRVRLQTLTGGPMR